MPHERIYDPTYGVAPGSSDGNAGTVYLEVGWSSGPTPLQADDEPEGWVQVRTISEKVDAKTSAQDIPQVVRDTRSWLEQNVHGIAQMLGGGIKGQEALDQLTMALVPVTRYAFGEDFTGYAVTLDRAGLNRAVRMLRRARDKAHGADA